jgi:hypothetical protein
MQEYACMGYKSSQYVHFQFNLYPLKTKIMFYSIESKGQKCKKKTLPGYPTVGLLGITSCKDHVHEKPLAKNNSVTIHNEL